MTQFLLNRFERMPELAIKLMPRLWCRMPAETERIYLTFDDGPHPERTPLILDLLDQFDLTATFFLIGKRAQKNPALVKRIAARHRIANHTWHHPNLRWQNAATFAAELEPTRRLLEDLAGVEVRLFRPPYGAFGPSLSRYAREHDHQIVLWQVLPWDFRPRRTSRQIADCLVHKVESGSIIVLHDGHHCAATTVQALQFSIPLLQDRGGKFAILPNRYFTEKPAAEKE